MLFFQLGFRVCSVVGLLTMRVCMRICRSFRVAYYIYVMCMSPINVHLFSRVHAHLRARLVPQLYICREMFVCSIPICACTRARSGRIHVTYTQHTRIIEGGADYRCACTRAYTLYICVTTRLSTRIASMRGCMRIYNSLNVLYHVYVMKM